MDEMVDKNKTKKKIQTNKICIFQKREQHQQKTKKKQNGK